MPRWRRLSASDSPQIPPPTIATFMRDPDFRLAPGRMDEIGKFLST
jgi:hypothetical protein